MQLRQRKVVVATFLLIGIAIALASCGGGEGHASINNAIPQISSLSPSDVIVGSKDFPLTVNGSNFTSSAKVLWNAVPVPTTYISSRQLTATISSSLVATAGPVSVSAQTISGQGNGFHFLVNNPVPKIDSISPDNAMAGAAALVVTINGSGFVTGATLFLNSSPQPVLAQTPTRLQTTIPTSDLATAGSLTISVANPDPAAGPSNQAAFTVTQFTSNPVPTLTSALDTSVPAGWPGFQLYVYGTNFVAASSLQWNSADVPTKVISSTELSAAISSDRLTSAGTVQVSVNNPSPGGGPSGTLPIQIQYVSPGATGVIERSDVATNLTESDGASWLPAVSGDGRYVAFLSSADNLAQDISPVSGEENLYLRNTCLGAPTGCTPSLTFISATQFFRPAISGNGRFVAFNSDAGVSLYDTCSGAAPACVPSTQLIDNSSNGEDGQVSLSADGRFAAFFSGGIECGYWDYCGGAQVFLIDTCAGTSSGCTPSSRAISPRVEVYTDSGTSLLTKAHPSISPDGRFIAFNTNSTIDVSTNTTDVALYDSCQGAGTACSPSTTIVSVASGGGASDGISYGASVSSGGRYVAFLSSASNLVPGNLTPGIFRVYLRDMCTGAPSGCTPETTLIAMAGDGTQSADDPSISADGRYVSFESGMTNLVPSDTNGVQDVFVFDTCAGVSSACSSSTVRVSVSLKGTQANADSLEPTISSDGRFVVFASRTKLGPGAPNPLGADVYLARH